MKKLTGSKLRKKLIKECGALVAQIVKARHPYCVICKFNGEMLDPRMTAGHFIPQKMSGAMRFDWEWNVFTQCAYHNSLHRFDRHPYDKWFIATFGQEKWEYMYFRQHNEKKSWKVWELEELRDELKLML